MSLISQLALKLERLLHPKIKELIAKSLVYFFTLKERNTFRQARYQGQPHLLDAFDQVFVIAHRGFSGKYPENTLLAFSKALEAQADMIELDIQISQDGELIVSHDAMLERLAGDPGYIRDLPLARLRQFEVGSWFQAAYAGEALPTLREVFERFDLALINIEIKHEASHFLNWETEKKLLALIAEFQIEDRVLISSFNPMIVNRVRILAPQLATAYLLTQTLNPLLIYLLGRIQARYVHVDLRYLNRRSVKRLHTAGLKVVAYTLNTPADFSLALALGVDGILTDYPDRLHQFLEAERLAQAKH